MFQLLRRIFHRLWFIISALRSALYGLMIIAVGWIFVIPPSPSEIARLNLPSTATVETETLRHYRMAKLLVLVASERTYELIAQKTGLEITGSDVQLAIQIAANGVPVPQDDSATSGAKFVSVDAN